VNVGYRYQFIVDFESPDECGIGVIQSIKEDGETPTGTEIAVVLRKLAAVYDNWPGTTIPVRYPAPKRDET
jgi:hypothetical protein